ncbi:MAG: SDR family oxidoreductase [Gemmatimonadota bacterium]|nr:MAG: SDR family oxidoreductase [Gemmatimonadota bacterium]
MKDLSGRTCAVTGANSGIGQKVAEGLAGYGATVIMVCRNRDRGEAARSKIAARVEGAELRLRLCDLAALDDVRRLARDLSSEHSRLDLLVNNAGVYRAKLEITADGFEKTMAVNHLAHFLLTHLLMAPLTAARGRVINVSSAAHTSGHLRRAPLESIIRGDGDYDGFRAYGDSKTANILFTRELARRCGDSGLTVAAVHPGAVATRIYNQNDNLSSLIVRLFKPLMRSPASGARPCLWLATRPDPDRMQGRYFVRMKEALPQPDARDDQLARRLWELSARLTGTYDGAADVQ